MSLISGNPDANHWVRVEHSGAGFREAAPGRCAGERNFGEAAPVQAPTGLSLIKGMTGKYGVMGNREHGGGKQVKGM
jgi:hypothetical protein